jgi:hypothetical protein
MALKSLASTSASQRQDFEISFMLLRTHPVRAFLTQRSGDCLVLLRNLWVAHLCWFSAGGKTIIFVDEIDALAPSREKGGAGGSELHNRIVATFLTLLDGVKPSAEEIGNLLRLSVALSVFYLPFSLPMSLCTALAGIPGAGCQLSYACAQVTQRQYLIQLVKTSASRLPP